MLVFSSWTLRTPLLGCLGCDTWCKKGVVGDLDFLVGKGASAKLPSIGRYSCVT